ncbi:MAG: hypothetical protein ACXVFK_09675 [Solirubrobacteraceae bacterium]
MRAYVRPSCPPGASRTAAAAAATSSRRIAATRHAGGGRGVDRGAVLLDAVGGLGGRDQEQRLRARQRRAQLVARGVAARAADLGAGEPRRAGGIAHHQALAEAGGGEPRGATAPPTAPVAPVTAIIRARARPPGGRPPRRR